jgi:catechol 2,3-dioxygenase-like lactoylglutathione lyase family enzyme
VQSLESVVMLLLQHGLRPYQVPVDQAARHPILSADDPLTFGIGTVFVEDPDGNSVEFVQAGRGIIGEILGEPTRSRNAAA